MDRFFRKKRNLIMTIICVAAIVLFIVLASTSRNDGEDRKFSAGGFLRNMFAPVNSFFTAVGNQVSSWGSFIFSLGDIKKENESLKAQVRTFETSRMELIELKAENERLAKLLDLKALYSEETVAAKIIYRDTTNWLGVFTINKGFADGVEEGMAVVSLEGLVGRIVEATKDTATVINIVDPRNSVGAINARTRDPLVAEGMGNEQATCKAYSFTSDVEFRVGDAIISSGIGGIYPKGHLLGYVTGIVPGKYGVSDDAIIEPVVDFLRLEEVLVLVSGQEGILDVIDSEDIK